MKPRGVSFAVEAITNIVQSGEVVSQEKADEIYRRLERVVLTQIDDFIPHYLIKILCSFAKAAQGSGELYDQVIQRVVPACLVKPVGSNLLPQKTVKYSDMVRFLEVFPQVTYIYEHTMTNDLYSAFMEKVQQVVRDKKLPTEDLCRVFNILVRISAYSNFDD